jgi:hypothetical protein
MFVPENSTVPAEPSGSLNESHRLIAEVREMEKQLEAMQERMARVGVDGVRISPQKFPSYVWPPLAEAHGHLTAARTSLDRVIARWP